MKLKIFLKKIPFLVILVRKLRKLQQNIKIFVTDFKHRRTIEHCIKSVSKSKTNKVIKVGFIVQLEALWNKQEPIFSEMLNRNDFEVKLLVVPNCDWSDHNKFDNYDNNSFLKNYPNEAIKVLDDNNNLCNIKKLNFDYVFFPRPYDAYLPLGLKSTDLVKFTRCCYIPYGYSLSDNFNDGNIDSSFFDNIYMEFTESDYIQSLLFQKYKKSCDKGIRHFEYLGFPCLEKYLNIKPREKISTITWTPRWSYEEKHGGSNFIEYKDSFLNFCKKLPKDIKVIFRPHPLMFDELIKKNILSCEEKDNYVKNLNSLNVKMNFEDPINVVLDATDLLITDFSSIITEFFLANKPIIYCKKNIEFNESGKKLEKFMYQTHSWDEIENYCFKLIDDGDVLRTDRQKFIEQEFSDIQNSSKKIVDRIIKDYRS